VACSRVAGVAAPAVLPDAELVQCVSLGGAQVRAERRTEVRSRAGSQAERSAAEIEPELHADYPEERPRAGSRVAGSAAEPAPELHADCPEEQPAAAYLPGELALPAWCADSPDA